MYTASDWQGIAYQFIMDIRKPPTLQGEFHEEKLEQLELTHVASTAARSGILVEVPQYGKKPFKVKKSSPYKLDPRSVAQARNIQGALGTAESVKEWEWAADKKGDQTMSKLLRLAQNSHKPARVDAIEALLLLADFLLSEPNINGQIIQEQPLDLQGIERTLVIRDSSSGNDLPQNPGGSNKRENAAWAVKEFVEQAAGKKQRAPFVLEVQPKSNEIIKVTKAQRKIFAQSTCDFVFSQICTHGLVYRSNSLCSKSASSLSMGGNTGYQMLRLLTPDMPWDDCRKRPGANKNIVQDAWNKLNEENALAEEDKTEWEYNLDIVLKVLFMLGTTIQVNWKGKECYLLPFTNSVASFLCPLVGICGKLAIAAPHFMPSGHLWTLKGNTGGHKLIVLSFKHKKQHEGYEDQAQLWYSSVLLQGDDFISRNIFGEEYSTFADAKWGCITKRSFGTAKEVKFLQRGLDMVRGQPRFSYDVERAKIKVSMPRPELYDHAEALKAAVLSTGSEELLNLLRPFYMDCKVPRVYITRDDRCTDAAFFDPGVLNTFWSANERLGKEVGTYFRLGNDYSMTPDYFDSVLRRAAQAAKQSE